MWGNVRSMDEETPLSEAELCEILLGLPSDLRENVLYLITFLDAASDAVRAAKQRLDPEG